MSLTIEELKEAILDRLDPDDIVDQLELSSEELLDAFTDKLIEKRYRFEWIEEEIDGSESI